MFAVLLFLLVFAVSGFSAETFVLGATTDATNFNQNGGIGADNGMALCRDSTGVLWGVLGNTAYAQGVAIFKGTTIDNMTKQYSAAYNFKVGSVNNPADGAAGIAFDNVPYPDGPRSRGCIWSMGLYIQSSGRFICYIHNETGWFAGNTGYGAHGLGDNEQDFRHVGAMYSDDQGRTWNFAGWMITAPQPCWTTAYQPDGMTGGQDPVYYSLGEADFGFIDNTARDSYVYIFVTNFVPHFDIQNIPQIYVARTNPNANPFIWNKYYNGSWNEPGNMGLETAVNAGGCEPAVAYSTYLSKFVMVTFNTAAFNGGSGGADVQMQSSPDLITWSAPQLFSNSGNFTYFTLCNLGSSGKIGEVGQTFRLLANKWGSPIQKADITATIYIQTPTLLKISGHGSIRIPNSGTLTAPYAATLLDQLGDTLSGQTIRWSLQPPNAGISIDTNTGMVSVSSGAGPESLAIIAATGAVTDSFKVAVISPTDPYEYTSGFDVTQGWEQWHYQYGTNGSYSDMTWDNANNRWNGNETYVLLWKSGGHPGVSTDAVLKWVAPRAGTVQITGTAQMASSAGTGDGVVVTIKKDLQTIWGPTVIAHDDVIGKSHDTTLAVSQGSAIYFIINNGGAGNNTFDGTNWDPAIRYSDGTNVDNGHSVIRHSRLSCNPNPFNPETAIRFTLDKQDNIAVAIYDARGECVRALTNGKQPPGAHSVIWNGRDNNGKLLPSGIYLVRLMGAGREETKRVLFVK